MNFNIKCKDYFIFKLRYYADKRVLDRFGPSHPQHWERAKLSNEFFWDFFEKVSGKNMRDYHREYMLDTVKCAKEELEETHGIYRFQLSDAYYTYLIPKIYPEIFEWVLLNIKSPHKILQRASVGFVNKQTSNYERTQSKKFTEKFKHDMFVRENTRKILFEKDENRPNKKRVNQFKDL